MLIIIRCEKVSDDAIKNLGRTINHLKALKAIKMNFTG